MNIEPLITRINALNKIMKDFTVSEPAVLRLFVQAIEKLTPILTDKDKTILNDTVHTHVDVVERLYECVEELNKDVETLELDWIKTLNEIDEMRNLLRIRTCVCGWTGREFQTLDYKHKIGARMCPECHEPTEILQEEDEE